VRGTRLFTSMAPSNSVLSALRMRYFVGWIIDLASRQSSCWPRLGWPAFPARIGSVAARCFKTTSFWRSGRFVRKLTSSYPAERDSYSPSLIECTARL
jgi:hypothetical protein